jgi:hypothetical protein
MVSLHSAIRRHLVARSIVAWEIHPAPPGGPESKFAAHYARAIVGDGVEYDPGVMTMVLKRPDQKYVVSSPAAGDVVLDSESDLNDYFRWRDCQLPEDQS